MAFVPADLGWAQGFLGGSTSLPPRGYVLPPPPGYNPQQTRPRAAEATAPPRARTVEEPQITKRSIPVASPKKKVPTEVAKSKGGSDKSSDKKSSAVAKNIPNTASKTTSKKEVAKAVPPKKSTDKPSSKTAVATSSAKPEPSSKKAAAGRSGEEVIALAAAKTSEKTSTAKLAGVNLGESPRDLHAPAGSGTIGAQPLVAKAATSVEAHDLPPPIIAESSLLQPNLTRGSAMASKNIVVTSVAQLPTTVRRSAAMMPLSLPAMATDTSSEDAGQSPAEPSAVSAADHAAGQMKMTLAGLATPPRASMAEEIQLNDTPPETKFERSEKTDVGGGTTIVTKALVKADLLPLPTESVVVSKINVSPVTESAPTPPTKVTRAVPVVTPTIASVRPAAYRPDADSVLPTESAEAFRSEAKFSAPDTPPVPTKPAVKLSPGLGALSIDAERADSETASNRVTFNGNVTMNCTRFTLKADKVVANMQEGEEANGVRKVVSEGHVVVHMNAPDGQGVGYIATGNQAIYDPEQETLRITGWPKIEEGNKALVASSASTEILIDTKSGRLTTTGSTRTVIK